MFFVMWLVEVDFFCFVFFNVMIVYIVCNGIEVVVFCMLYCFFKYLDFDE